MSELQLFGVFDNKTTRGTFTLDNDYVTFVVRPGQANEVKHTKSRSDIVNIEFTPTLHEIKCSVHFPKHTFRFVGLSDEDVAEIRAKANSFDIPVIERPLCINGRSWGMVEINNGLATLALDNKVLFDFALSNVHQTITQTKHDLEFVMKVSPAPKENQIELTSVRLHIPIAGTENAADELNTVVKAAADNLQENNNDIIVRFDDLSLQFPRGKYTFLFRHDGFVIQSKTYSNLLLYSQIKRLLYLDQDADTKLFLMGLEPPLKQGSSSYSFLVIPLEIGPEIQLLLNASDDDFQTKWNGKLSRDLTDTLQNVFPFIVQSFTSNKILGADKTFATRNNCHYISATYKGSDGSIYMLKKSLLFLRKPTLMLRFEDMKTISFPSLTDNARLGGPTFEFKIDFKDSSLRAMEFISIPNEDYDALFTYLKTTGVTILKQDILEDLVGKLEEASKITAQDREDNDRIQEVLASLRQQGDNDDDDDNDDDEYEESGSSDENDEDDEMENDEDTGSSSNKRHHKKSSSHHHHKKDKKDKKDKKSKDSKKDKKDKKRHHSDDSGESSHKKSKHHAPSSPTSQAQVQL